MLWRVREALPHFSRFLSYFGLFLFPHHSKNAEEEKPGEISNPNESAKKADSDSFKFPVDNELDSNRSSSSSNDHTSDSEDSDTDEEEVMQWASKMFGVPLPSPIARRKSSPEGGREEEGPNETASKENSKLLIRLSPTKTTNPGVVGAQSRTLKPEVHKKKKRKKKHCQSLVSEKLDKKVVIKALESSKTKKGRKKKKHSILPPPQEPEEEIDEEKERIEREEEKRKKEAAKPLTAAQIRAILGEDDFPVGAHDNWVRRSVRQPSRALLNSKPVKSLVEKLKSNDKDMVVLKMKKFINDQNAPQAVLDVALDALEENSNCEALYIQVSSKDERCLRLRKPKKTHHSFLP